MSSRVRPGWALALATGILGVFIRCSAYAQAQPGAVAWRVAPDPTPEEYRFKPAPIDVSVKTSKHLLVAHANRPGKFVAFGDQPAQGASKWVLLTCPRASSPTAPSRSRRGCS